MSVIHSPLLYRRKLLGDIRSKSGRQIVNPHTCSTRLLRCGRRGPVFAAEGNPARAHVTSPGRREVRTFGVDGALTRIVTPTCNARLVGSPWTDYITVRRQIPLVWDSGPLTPSGYASLFHNAYVAADLRVLRSPDDILAAVRAAAAYRTVRRGECLAPIPWDKAPGCAVGVPHRMIVRPGDGYVQYLHMPIDEPVETVCQAAHLGLSAAEVAALSGRVR